VTKRRLLYILFCTGFVLATAGVLSAETLQHPIFETRLRARVADIDSDQMVPLLIKLRNPIPSRLVYSEIEGMNLVERRRHVVRRLKEHFAHSEKGLVEYLQSEQERANAFRVRELWLAHAIVLELRADRIGELASWDNIGNVRYDFLYPRELVFDEQEYEEPAEGEVGLDLLSWGVQRMGAHQLWNQGFRGEGVLLAIIDSGVQISHPDLIDHVWVNPGEIPGNGVDDDENGFIDDIHGWSFFLENGNIDDLDGHGTRSAGVAVGDGTNGDSTGVAPDATFMVLQNYDPSLLWSSEASQLLAVQYAIDNGADVITCSMSYPRVESSDIIPDYVSARYAMEMSLAAGMIHANSTGNTGVSYGVPWNVNSPANCPPPWLHPDQTIIGGVSSILSCGMISSSGAVHSLSARGVSAWEDEGYPAEFQDYPWENGAQLGLLKPDLVGPSGVPTTSLNGTYRSSWAGTSASTPNLGGCLVLLRQIHPQAPPEALAEAVYMTAIDAGPVGFDTAYGAGEYRVNLAHEYLDGFFAYGALHIEVTTGDGEVPEGLRIVLGDDEIRRSIRYPEDYLPRVLPGEYRVRLYAEGYSPAEALTVVIAAGDTTELSLDLHEFAPGITPLEIDLLLQPGDEAAVPVTISNQYETDRQFRISLVPGQGLDWVPEERILIEEHLGTIIRQAATCFNGYYLVGGTRDNQAKVWRFDDSFALVDSVLLPAVFSPQGINGMLAYQDTLFITNGTGTVRMLDEDFSIVDELDFSEAGPYLRGIAVDPQSDHFFLSVVGSTIIREVNRDGILLAQHASNASVIGMAWHPDHSAGARLLILDNSNGGRGRLKAMDLETGQLDILAELSTPSDFNSSHAIALHKSANLGTWEVLLLMRETGLEVHRREVWSELYTLPNELTIPSGGAGFDFQLFTESLPDSGEYHWRLRFGNVTDGWTIHLPVELTISTSHTPDSEHALLPAEFALHPPWPNPFNSSVRLTYELPSPSDVRVRVVNLLGQTVALLADGRKAAGEHSLHWQSGQTASGLYFVVLEAGEQRRIRKLVLMR